MQKPDCIINIAQVPKGFGDKAVLDDVNLYICKYRQKQELSPKTEEKIIHP